MAKRSHSPLFACVAIRFGLSWVIGLMVLAGPTVVQAQSSDSVTVRIISEPDSAFIYLNNSDAKVRTPVSLRLAPGEPLIEVVLEGYEPLAKRFTVSPGEAVKVRFVLKALPPPPVLAESLGLEKKPVKPTMKEDLAKRLEGRWTGLAETFAIVPLGQGVLARLILPKEQHSSAHAMIITGAGLTLGSYFIGKMLGKKKLAEVRRWNEAIPKENIIIKQHNSDVDKAVEAANEAIIMAWLEQTKNQGEVVITRE